MQAFRPRSTGQQLAEHLKQQIHSGALSRIMPGANRLKQMLGVNSRAVETALHQLEKEGFLVPQGAGRPRLIRIPENARSQRMRINVLLHDRGEMSVAHIVEMRRLLEAAGFPVAFAEKSQTALDWKLSRIQRLVRATPSGAWMVMGGSYDILKWFSEQPFPVFGLFGRIRDLPIAGTGPDLLVPQQKAVERLLELGHRRIVMLAQEPRRKPQPGFLVRAFLDQLESHGIEINSFNLPEWTASREGVRKCLDSLFRFTPPTAFLVDTPQWYFVVRDSLAQRHLDVPGQVSLICQEADDAFLLHDPVVAHIDNQSAAWARRILQWARKISRGGVDVRQSRTKAEFIEGGTIGPAPK